MINAVFAVDMSGFLKKRVMGSVDCVVEPLAGGLTLEHTPGFNARAP